jgi:DNA repair protein RadD
MSALPRALATIQAEDAGSSENQVCSEANLVAIVLRNYQAWHRHHILQAMKSHKSVLAVGPTGSGKRLQIVDLCLLAAEHGRRVLVATNRRLLVTQMAAECEKHGVHYGVIMSDHFEGDPAGPIQIASLQTMESWYFYERWTNEATGRGLPPASLIVIDEAHQEAHGRYLRLRDFYPDAKTLGFTATPVGSSGRALCPSAYDVLVEGPKNSELIAQGHLLPTVVYAPSEPNIEGVRIVNGQEYNQNQLGRAVQECTVFADVYEHWLNLASDRATVCFVPGIPFGRDLVRQFNFLLGAGSVHLIEAKTKHTEREDILQKTAAGEAKIVVSCDVLREGFDLPVLSCGIDLQPNSQLRSYWQKLGRIKRPHGDQREALWLDFAGNYWRFPHPDEDPEWPVGEETTQEVIASSRKAGKTAQPIMCPGCGRVRERGPTCPACGHTAGELIRRIRMGNGKLEEIPAIAKAKVEKSEAQKLFSKWQSKLFGALAAGWTYGQCAVMFQKETGQRPPLGWPGTFPETDKFYLGKRPAEDHDRRSLSIACYETKRNLK